MVRILAASSLHHSLEDYKTVKKHYSKNIIAIPGLSLNHRGINFRKTVQHQISKFVNPDEEILLWHDTVNNTLTEHKSNRNCPLTVKELIETLKGLSSRICGIVYIQRLGAPNVCGQLKELGKELGIPVLNVIKDLLPKRKAKNKRLLKKYRSLHVNSFLEIKTLCTIVRYRFDLSCIIKKKKRPSSRKRRTELKRRLAATKPHSGRTGVRF